MESHNLAVNPKGFGRYVSILNMGLGSLRTLAELCELRVNTKGLASVVVEISRKKKKEER